jgi:hypothetical protein
MVIKKFSLSELLRVTAVQTYIYICSLIQCDVYVVKLLIVCKNTYQYGCSKSTFAVHSHIFAPFLLPVTFILLL